MRRECSSNHHRLAGASNILAAYNLSYDQDNRITSLSSWTDGFKTTFGYDTRDQLTSATTSQISGIAMPYLLGVESYGFDATGNRNTAGSNTPALSHNQQEKDGTYEYQYDDEGNVLLRSKVGSWQATEYEWDQRNRLVSVANRSHYYYPTNYTSGGSTQPGVYAHCTPTMLSISASVERRIHMYMTLAEL